MSRRPARSGGRDGWEVDPEARPYGGAWEGPIFILTHHPEDAAPAEGVTFLSCDVAEAVRIGLEAAGGKNLEVFSPTIGPQLLERGLIDEIDLHIVPVLLGEGIRLFDNPGGQPIRLRHASGSDPVAAVNVRYHPVGIRPSAPQGAARGKARNPYGGPEQWRSRTVAFDSELLGGVTGAV